MKKLIFFGILVATSLPVVGEECGQKLSDIKKFLGESHGTPVWIETSMDDGKPLFIVLSERSEKLHLVFFKSKEGIWAEGTAQLCKDKAKDKKVVAKVSGKDITVGKVAPRLIRWGMSGGAKFKLFPEGEKEKPKLKISASGWGGTFVPSTDQVFKDASAAVKAQ